MIRAATLVEDLDAQIREHWPLVRRLAALMVCRTPRSISFEELEAAGAVGLLEALRRYDPALGPSWRAFASRRIRGAMLDWLREVDPLKRRRGRGGRRPFVRLEALGELADRRVELEAAHLEARETVEAVLRRLPARDRRMLELRYVEERTLADIAAELGISESRACQLAGRALWRAKEAWS